MLLNCGVGEDSWESLGLQGDPPVHPKGNQSWVLLKLKLQYFGHLMWRADSFEKTLMLGKIEDERRRDSREWDDWMASLTQWIWVWVNSKSWWWTGRPGVLQSMGLQRVRHNWVTELNWIYFPYEWEQLRCEHNFVARPRNGSCKHFMHFCDFSSSKSIKLIYCNALK